MFFCSVKEACTLLTLPKGSAILLLDVLAEILGGGKVDEKAVTDPIAALREVGIHKLSLDECQHILRLRTDLYVTCPKTVCNFEYFPMLI